MIKYDPVVISVPVLFNGFILIVFDWILVGIFLIHLLSFILFLWHTCNLRMSLLNFLQPPHHVLGFWPKFRFFTFCQSHCLSIKNKKYLRTYFICLNQINRVENEPNWSKKFKKGKLIFGLKALIYGSATAARFPSKRTKKRENGSNYLVSDSSEPDFFLFYLFILMLDWSMNAITL